MQPLQVLIIGTGNIAGGFDMQRDKSLPPLTHAGGYAKDPRFQMMACVDPDDDKRLSFTKIWSITHSAASIEQLPYMEEGAFDVISICSPTSVHAEHIQQAIALQPKLIFCEKPLTPSVQTSEDIVAACHKSHIQLAVNYSRRWDPDVMQLREDIASNRLGELRSVNAIYNKGLMNNGSHMLDLLLYLLGELDIVYVGDRQYDYFDNDPTLPLSLQTADGIPVQVGTADARDYALFELQLVFSSGVLVMEEGGLYWRERRVQASTHFSGYKTLSPGERREGRYAQSMLRALDNIYAAIVDHAEIVSNGESAIAVQKLCERALNYGDRK